MNIENLKSSLPVHVKDIRLNLGMILSDEGTPDLSREQKYGIAMACAYATGHLKLIEAILQEGELSDQILEAAQSAAMIMGMNNVYYRFVHLSGDPIYASMPAKLRMNVIGNPGIAKADFELYCLAVSALNGCGLCMESHVRELEKSGISRLAIQSAVRVAAVLNAVACGLRIG